MARNRMLNPEFFLDEEMATITPHARLLYQGLWGICDDNYATLPNRPDWIKAQVFPYEILDVTKLLEELRGINKIILFSVEGKEYWYLKNFKKHQKVDHPSRSKYPEFKENMTIHSRVLGESSLSNRIEQNRIEEIPVPKTAGISSLSKKYLSRFAKPSKISSARQFLATEIYEWSGKKLDFAMLMRLIKLKGEQFSRQCWAEVKQSDANEPYKVFMWKLGKIKIKLT